MKMIKTQKILTDIGLIFVSTWVIVVILYSIWGIIIGIPWIMESTQTRLMYVKMFAMVVPVSAIIISLFFLYNIPNFRREIDILLKT